MSQIRYQIEPLSMDTFAKIRALIYEKANISMRESKHILVSNRLRKRVLTLGLSGYDEYYRYLTDDAHGPEELQHFIDALSTNETYFYRETNHLTVLEQTILPTLFAQRKRLHLWSAGCSTGEEAYTLRILFEEGLGTRWEGELEIIATDVNAEVVQSAKEGIYGERSTRLVPKQLLAKYFRDEGEAGHRIADRLRGSIDFQVHNLLKDPPPRSHFDIIFCRNVMIYFDKGTQTRLADEYFAPVMSPNGYLCIGHSESLTGTSRAFRLVRGLKAPVYQLAPREGGL